MRVVKQESYADRDGQLQPSQIWKDGHYTEISSSKHFYTKILNIKYIYVNLDEATAEDLCKR